MTVSGIGGFVYAVSGIVLAIALLFSHHYWQQQRAPRIGQSKKRRFRTLMRRWIYVAVIATAVAFIGAAGYYLGPPTKAHAYAKIVDSQLIDLAVGKSATLSFVVENAGLIEISGSVGSVTWQFNDTAHPQSLKILPMKPGADSTSTFKLVPGERRTFIMPYETLKVNEDQLKRLNEHVAELYFFANGEYRDESGNKYPLPYCRRYEHRAQTQGYLVYCDDDIKVE